MMDREMVIKGLKYLHDVKCWSPDESEESITARRNITGDALVLLKARTPHVMTLEEVVSIGDKEAMYLEHMNGDMIVCPVVLLTTYLDWDKDCLHFAGGWRCCGSFGINGYGETWRCWTSRPDQATREATPWE